MSKLEGRGLPEARLRDLLSGGLNVSGRELGISFGVHSVRRQPPGEGKTFVTYTARIGYALPDDPRNRTLLEAGRSSLLVVPVDVSINEPIGADQRLVLGDIRRSLRVSTPEDIVAEKLRAFLQQKETVRNRERPQDLLDIAHLLRRNMPLNLGDVSRFLLRKAEARNVHTSPETSRLMCAVRPAEFPRLVTGSVGLAANPSLWHASPPTAQYTSRRGGEDGRKKAQETRRADRRVGGTEAAVRVARAGRVR